MISLTPLPAAALCISPMQQSDGKPAKRNKAIELQSVITLFHLQGLGSAAAINLVEFEII